MLTSLIFAAALAQCPGGVCYPPTLQPRPVYAVPAPLQAPAYAVPAPPPRVRYVQPRRRVWLRPWIVAGPAGHA